MSATPPARLARPGRPGARRLGTLLTDAGLLERSDLERALARQKETNQLLGEVLVGMGLLTTAELELVLTVQRTMVSLEQALRSAAGVRERLGELLLGSGRIDRHQLESALEVQLATGKRLGEVLLSMNLVTAAELDAILAFQACQSAPPSAGPLRLGEILVATRRITSEQLADALERQKTGGRRLGEVLVEAGYAAPETVGWALRLQRGLVRAVLAGLVSLAALAGTQAAAQSASTQLSVSVTVVGRTIVTPSQQQRELVVTAEDVARGFVDAPLATLLDVQTNNREGYLLSFENALPSCRELRVGGLGSEVVVTGGSGWIRQPYSAPTSRYELSFRFVLAPDARPGTYSWPVTVVAAAL